MNDSGAASSGKLTETDLVSRRRSSSPFYVTAQTPAGSVLSFLEKPGVAAGEAVHWLLSNDRVLSLKLHAGSRQALAVVEPGNVPRVYKQNVQLMRTPDAELGLVSATRSALRLWALEHDGHGGAASSWTLRRTLFLHPFLPGLTAATPGRFGEMRSLAAALLDQPDRYDDDGGDSRPCARIVGVDEDGTVVFLRRIDGLFMLQLQPVPRITNICEGFYVLKHQLDTVYPYSELFLRPNI